MRLFQVLLFSLILLFQVLHSSLILHCIKQLYLFEMRDCEQYGCHTHTFSPGDMLL